MKLTSGEIVGLIFTAFFLLSLAYRTYDDIFKHKEEEEKRLEELKRLLTSEGRR